MRHYSTRRGILAGSVATVTALAGCTGDSDGTTNGDDSSTGDSSNGDENGDSDREAIFEAGNSYSFEGDGATETDRFELEPGLMRYQFESEAIQNIFTSHLVDMDGDTPSNALDDRMLTNYRSPIEGEMMNIVSGGEYLIDINVDGPWSIEIDQPAAYEDDIEPLPLEATGEQTAFVGPVELEDDTEVHATHDGENSFGVHAITTDGHWDVTINDLGTVDSTRPFRDQGIAWISIIADGDWSISIE